ncbi:response regulator transcription factor [Acinetobacter boissieri]|uniref:Two-component system, OmpR family, KDP operon response regulator KdpE n=1 Tax=Acinetobacter boissieri TaxID=1219383 RepID=A0A1G6J7D8_9GAMM|nr:response regulator transcription factor [Acinetobacter boissieri]SDC14265.1 two-component system, OmpR family, KDP operon response regulator KdpE [Acinetobacter boissieri]
MSNYKILVIDDEPQIRRFIEIALKTQNHHVLLAETGLKGIQFMIEQMPDLVILDLGLPDMDGHEVLQEIRKWSNTPVMVLSARPDEMQKVLLLDAGANDYVTKPFNIQELFARIRVLLRSRHTVLEVPTVFDDGYLYINIAAHVVKIEDISINLTKKEFQLLALLLKHQGQIVAQADIIRELWGSTHTEDTHYLRILTKKLRDKLEGGASKYITTISAIGLRFELK